MAEISNSIKRAGNIIVENRQKFTASGICDVENFSPDKIILLTTDSILTVTGSGMKIKKLSTENGDIFIEGEINGCVYSKGKGDKEGFLKRVLK